MTPIYKQNTEHEKLYNICQSILPLLRGVPDRDCAELLTDSERTFASCVGLTYKQALALKLARAQIIAEER